MPQGVEQSLKNEPSTLKPDIEGMVQHKKTTAKRWIDHNMRDSAGSPVMGVRGKYESPVRDHKKATAKRWLFCGPNRA